MGGEGVEARGFSEVYQVAEESQGAGVEGVLQAFDEKAAEELCERLDGEKEVRGRPATQRVPSGERPPPGTTQCTCG